MAGPAGARSHEQFVASPTPNWGGGPCSGAGPAGVRDHGHSGRTGSLVVLPFHSLGFYYIRLFHRICIERMMTAAQELN